MLYYSILSFLWAFLIAVFAIPSIIYVAHIKNLLDEPNLRTMHQSLTPRLGGLAIFAGFMSALTIFGDLNHGVQEILAGAIVIFFIGLKDDIVAISAFKKFFVQVLATCIVMFMGNIRLTSFQGVLGIYELEPGTSYFATFIIIIGITNAINLIDGLDGLAGAIVLIISATFGIYFYLYGGNLYAPYIYLACCLFGAVLGFLRYNFHKAIIFMGDTGSLVCGFIISLMAIQFIEMKPVNNTPLMAVAVLIIPILDTIRVFIIRILNGASPFSPDKNHIHHKLIGLGISQLTAVGILTLINILIILTVIYYDYLNSTSLLIILFVFAIVTSIVLEVISYKRPAIINDKID